MDDTDLTDLAEKHLELWGEGPVPENSYNPNCPLCSQMIHDVLHEEYFLARTKTGRTLTSDDIDRLAEEAAQ